MRDVERWSLELQRHNAEELSEFRVWGLGLGVWGLGFRVGKAKPRKPLNSKALVAQESSAKRRKMSGKAEKPLKKGSIFFLIKVTK